MERSVFWAEDRRRGHTTIESRKGRDGLWVMKGSEAAERWADKALCAETKALWSLKHLLFGFFPSSSEEKPFLLFVFCSCTQNKLAFPKQVLRNERRSLEYVAHQHPGNLRASLTRSIENIKITTENQSNTRHKNQFEWKENRQHQKHTSWDITMQTAVLQSPSSAKVAQSKAHQDFFICKTAEKIKTRPDCWFPHVRGKSAIGTQVE